MGFEAWVFGLGVQETRFLSSGERLNMRALCGILRDLQGPYPGILYKASQLASITRLWGLGPGGLVLKSLGLRYIIFLKELHQFP